ncbi:N protein [Sodak rhabdovirus 1]|uniref:Nucleoprotein n=1 Tax=Sodak rhabdovirus 1 TaxID=2793799 RepID=A0A7T1KMW2_9RHAB|nr:N protein [Sodak rhabdovirus 1]QPO14167.1 N protein [Sodak rhabdovirus 1]
MNKFKLYDIESRKELEVDVAGITKSAEYLTEMKGKPPVAITQYETPHAVGILKTMINDGLQPETDVKNAIAFIYHVAQNIKGTLLDDWISYGIVIGRGKDEITPLDLLDVTVHNESLKIDVTQDKTDPNEYGLLAKVLIPYRIAGAPVQQSGYRSELARRLGEVFATEPFNLKNVTGVLSVVHWANNPDYCKLVAAIDMFLRKFPDHEMEKLRACTLGSYLKDCVMLSAIGQSAEALLINPATLLQYVFSNDLAEDVRRITRPQPNEERSVDHSYFQYMREFKLVPRSPYSASLNPNLFIWTQIIGALSGKRRSMYARMIDCASPGLTFIQAAYVVFHLKRHPQGKLYFVDDLSKLGSIRQASDDRSVSPVKEDGLMPVEVLQSMIENQYSLTDEMREEFTCAIKAIDGSRPGTVGEYIKKCFSENI